MRIKKVLSRSAMVVGFAAATALADGQAQLVDFFYVENTPVLDTLCIVAGPDAVGKSCTVWEVNIFGVRTAVASLTLVEGPNTFVVPDLLASTYIARGPEIQTKYINPGVN